MRHFVRIALTLSLALVCTAGAVNAQSQLMLEINASLDGQPFSYGSVHTDPSSAYSYKLSDLRYYVSKIALIHEGGAVTELTDLYLLVDLSSTVQVYNLQTPSVTDVKQIRFSIGVDQAHNHLDPTVYPSTHPLSPQLPTMHWGWSAGYRFCTLEGTAGALEGNPTTRFEVHSVGDELYKTVTVGVGTSVDGGATILIVNAEYGSLLTGIEAQWGPIQHGSTGESATLMNNFATNVFSAPVVASVEPLPLIAFGLAPNPTSDEVTISTGEDSPVQVTVVDQSGVVVLSHKLASGSGRISTTSLASGSYTLVARTAMGSQSTQTFAIVR